MTFDQIILILIVLATTTLYITRWTPIEVTSALAISALVFSGLLTVDQALSGFASAAMITVAAMFVLSGGLLRTGALEQVTVFLVRTARGNLRHLLLSISLVTGTASAFVNNTPVVIMMVPILLSLSNKIKILPSKLLIPLSYLGIMGGTMTLLGTSTNILVDDLYRKAGGPGFGMFEFTPLGVILMAVGIVYIVLLSQRLLPNRAPLIDLMTIRQKTAYITELVVEPDSPFVGQPVTDVFQRVSSIDEPKQATIQRRHRRVSRSLPTKRDEQGPDDLELLELIRARRVFRAKETLLLTLEPRDLLVVAGTPNEITQFVERNAVEVAPVLSDGKRVPVDDVRSKVIEAVVLPNSPLDGQLVGELELNRLYGVKIMGMQHHSQHRATGISNVRLRAGDVLLLQALPAGLQAASEQGKLLLVEGVDQAILRTDKNRIALLIMLGVVTLATLTQLPIAALAIAGAALMVVTKCLRTGEALQSINASTLFLIAGTIPMGLAIQTTGLAHVIVDRLLHLLGTASPLIVPSVLYLLTTLLTAILTNNAVAVLLTPIALDLAASLGVNATPLLMAVAFGASASFSTPMGYQTNAIVMGPGGYTFGDYLRVGIPLSIIFWLLASLFIPVLWPL